MEKEVDTRDMIKNNNNMKNKEYCPYCQFGPCTGECDKHTSTRIK